MALYTTRRCPSAGGSQLFAAPPFLRLTDSPPSISAPPPRPPGRDPTAVSHVDFSRATPQGEEFPWSASVPWSTAVTITTDMNVCRAATAVRGCTVHTRMYVQTAHLHRKRAEASHIYLVRNWQLSSIYPHNKFERNRASHYEAIERKHFPTIFTRRVPHSAVPMHVRQDWSQTGQKRWAYSSNKTA